MKFKYYIPIFLISFSLHNCEQHDESVLKPIPENRVIPKPKFVPLPEDEHAQDVDSTLAPRSKYKRSDLPEYVKGSIAEEEALLDEREWVVTNYPLVWPPEPPSFAELLVQAALERTTHSVRYDGSYFKIDYPMGDVPDAIGVCTDVVIRSYRQLGIDLQELLHKDIKRHFRRYPNQSRWGLSRPDTNIDHRRVPNLRVFLDRHGASLPISDEARDYKPGDLVTWVLNNNMVHIGIVANQYVNEFSDRRLIIHNIGSGPELGDILFEYDITGHYRYQPD